MAGHHLLAAPLAPARTMFHSRNIDWGTLIVTLSRGQGEGGTATPQSPKANDLLRGFTRGQCQFQKSRCGWGREGWWWLGDGDGESYGTMEIEVLYITASRSYGSSWLLDVVTVCDRWSGRGGLHTSCSLYMPTILTLLRSLHQLRYDIFNVSDFTDVHCQIRHQHA